jgi:SAM-dependent methyltransferase
VSASAKFEPLAFKAFEREGWERVPAGYADTLAAATAQCIPAMLDTVGGLDGVRLLDVACGPGALTQAAAERGAQAVGLDFSASMLEEARRRHPGIEFRQGDAEHLPFEAGEFGAVVCAFGILHFADPDRAVAEAHRVLAAGGRFAFSAWCPSPGTFFEIVTHAIKAHGDPNVSIPAGPPFFRFGDGAECERVLRAAGFAEAEARVMPAALRCARPNDVLEVIARGTVRTVGVLSRQRPEARASIERAILEAASRHVRNGGIELPMPYVLAAGRK